MGATPTLFGDGMSRPRKMLAAITDHLSELLSPIGYSQQAYYRTLGMRDLMPTLHARWAQRERPLCRYAVLVDLSDAVAEAV
jgi:hypothetical protein